MAIDNHKKGRIIKRARSISFLFLLRQPFSTINRLPECLINHCWTKFIFRSFQSWMTEGRRGNKVCTSGEEMNKEKNSPLSWVLVIMRVSLRPAGESILGRKCRDGGGTGKGCTKHPPRPCQIDQNKVYTDVKTDTFPIGFPELNRT